MCLLLEANDLEFLLFKMIVYLVDCRLIIGVTICRSGCNFRWSTAFIARPLLKLERSVFQFFAFVSNGSYSDVLEFSVIART